MDFITTIGVEHTKVPARHYTRGGYFGDAKSQDISHLLTKQLKKDGLHKKGYSKVKPECGALEISSPVIKSAKELEEFWNISEGIFKKSPHKLVANTIADNTYIEGGGGHIHVGVQSLPPKIRQMIYNRALFLALNYPEITWFFQEYVDEDSLTSNFFKAIDRYCGQPLRHYNESIVSLFARDYLLGWGSGPIQIRNKQIYAAKKAKNTIEFRAFGAYPNFKRLQLCVEFALAYYKYISQHGIWLNNFSIKKELKKYCNNVKLNPELAINRFNQLLMALGLNPKNYKCFHANFRTRLLYGRLHNF